MKRGIATAVRVVTGLTLLALSLNAARVGHGFVRLLAGVEVVTAVAFCLPQVWRFGGIGLLAVLGFALIHHALLGQFASSLLFAALVIVLELTYERS